MALARTYTCCLISDGKTDSRLARASHHQVDGHHEAAARTRSYLAWLGQRVVAATWLGRPAAAATAARPPCRLSRWRARPWSTHSCSAAAPSAPCSRPRVRSRCRAAGARGGRDVRREVRHLQRRWERRRGGDRSSSGEFRLPYGPPPPSSASQPGPSALPRPRVFPTTLPCLQSLRDACQPPTTPPPHHPRADATHQVGAARRRALQGAGVQQPDENRFFRVLPGFVASSASGDPAQSASGAGRTCVTIPSRFRTSGPPSTGGPNSGPRRFSSTLATTSSSIARASRRSARSSLAWTLSTSSTRATEKTPPRTGRTRARPEGGRYLKGTSRSKYIKKPA